MRQKSVIFPWLIWVLSALFVVFNYIQQVIPNVIAFDLSQAFKAKESTLGNIAAIYFYSYAILQIPVGLIVDRFGTRRPLVLAIAMAGLGTLGFSSAYSSDNAQIARLVMGASSAFSFIGCLKLVEEWFPASRFSTLAGMTNTAGMLGAASCGPLAVVTSVIGWRETVAWLGGAQLFLAVLVLIVVSDRRESAVSATPSAPAAPVTSLGGLSCVLKNPQVWINAIYATSISLIFVAFGGLWGASYIEKAYGLSAVTAAGIGSLLFLGGISGSLFFGWYSDYLGRRKLPMVLAGVGALLTMACLLYIPCLPLLGFQTGLFLVGFFSSANIISYAVARDLYPKFAGLSIGFLSTCFYAGSAASQPLVGMLLEQKSGSAVGLAALTPEDYRYAFSLLVAFMVLGLVASLTIKETLPRTIICH